MKPVKNPSREKGGTRECMRYNWQLVGAEGRKVIFFGSIVIVRLAMAHWVAMACSGTYGQYQLDSRLKKILNEVMRPGQRRDRGPWSSK